MYLSELRSYTLARTCAHNHVIINVSIFTILIDNRYEIDWIGREGLACETHDEFLRVSSLKSPLEGEYTTNRQPDTKLN